MATPPSLSSSTAEDPPVSQRDQWLKDNEAFATGLEKWLKEARDEEYYTGWSDTPAWSAVDNLLNEARDAFVVGRMPWERERDV